MISFCKILFVSLSMFLSFNAFSNENMSFESEAVIANHNNYCGDIHCPTRCENTYGCSWVNGHHGRGYCTESYSRYDYCEDISCPTRCENTDGCHWSHRRHACVSVRHHH